MEWEQMLEQLEERYRQYAQTVEDVCRKCSPADGLFGLGNPPKNHPCHEVFYDDVGQWLQAFLALQPDAQHSLAAARFIITAPTTCTNKECYWIQYAALGWCQALVDRLDQQGCKELRDFFDESYPRQDRMPVQQKLYKALKKGAAKR